MGALRIAGIEAATTDIIFSGPARAMRDLLAGCGLASEGVEFVDDTERPARARALLASVAPELRAPGGTVANTLCALRRGLGASAEFEVAWLGVDVRRPFELAAESPLSSLRRSGIVPYLGGPTPLCERTALVTVDQATGGILSVTLSPSDLPVEPATPWPAPGILVLTLQRGLVLESVDAAEGLVLLIADAPLDTRAGAFLRRHAGKLKVVFGHRRELEALGLDSSRFPPDELAGVDLVGTDGEDPVTFWDGERRCWHSLPIAPAERSPEGNELGLGDAYAGAFLAARLTGSTVEEAHARGCKAAREVFASSTSRPLPEQNLNRLFGERLRGRESADEGEGRLFETVRRTCGITLVSCGQTGIDQAGIAVAARLGLPSFAILPAGRRTEAAEGLVEQADDFGDSCVVELGSASYRYCTWTNVYCADGSLIWDFRGSEGSEETRIACRALGRPYLDLAGLDVEGAVEETWRWAEAHGVRVIHIAGNRASHLQPEERAHASRQMRALLMALSARRAARLAATNGHPPLASYQRVRLGVPNTSESRSLLREFLNARAAGDWLQPKRRLHHALDPFGLEIFFVRARDLCAMLDQGLLDAALLGSDLVAEYEPDADVLLDTGLQPCLLVMLGRSGDTSDPSALGSQYPSLAAARAGSGTVHELRGTAEAWLATGFIDGVLDTWRTGATAYANGLEMREALAATFLVLVARRGARAEVRQGAEALAADLGTWLRSGGLRSLEVE